MTAILAGPLGRDHAQEYARVMELLLNHVGRPLATKYKAGLREPADQILLVLTQYVPNDSSGRWNPLLRACKLPKLAKLWGEPNVSFPWHDAKQRPRLDWPVWTLFDHAVLSKIAAEMGPLTKDSLEALPAKILAAREKDAEQCREELWTGLNRLRAWVATALAPEEAEGIGWAKRGNALVLLMDGDQ